MNNAMAEFEKRNKEQHDKLNQMRPYQQQTVIFNGSAHNTYVSTIGNNVTNINTRRMW